MAKSKNDKKINRLVKRINRQLKEDVFGDRFWIRQIQKQKVDGVDYYLYEMRDREEPNRNSLIKEGWMSGYDFFLAAHFYEAINDFIVKSDFWNKYNGSLYSEEVDVYAHEFYHYHSKNI